MKYVLLIHLAEARGFRAQVPALPGCHTQGETIEQFAARAREAIESDLGALVDA